MALYNILTLTLPQCLYILIVLSPDDMVPIKIAKFLYLLTYS